MTREQELEAALREALELMNRAKWASYPKLALLTKDIVAAERRFRGLLGETQ